MAQVDLEKDLEKLERYEAESLIGQLGVVQLHLEDVYSGKEPALCIDCMENKHLPIIEVLATECLGICSTDSLWEEITKWARDFKENKLNSQYIGKGNKQTLELRNQARNFRKKLGEILRTDNRANPVGDEKMLEKRGVEAPDVGDVGSTDNPGKTEETKQKTKKGSLLPWLLGGAGVIGYLLYKKKQAQAEARQEAEARQQEQAKQTGPGEVPASTLHLPVEGFSATERLKGMGLNTNRPSCYQSGEPYQEP